MLKWFSEIKTEDVFSCGWKWASLWEMTNAWFNVPDWFVVTTNAYWKDHNLWAKEVGTAFDSLDCKFVAVRSSATKEDGVDDSFAWQFDTYLFVTKEDLIEQIMECHNSINSDRIKSYCEFKGINRDEIKVAVVVQKMINSESAGVSFTINPVTNNINEIMVEAGWGVWEAVVSWMITPDNYIINKQEKNILSKNISKQEKKLVLDIENTGLKEERIEETIQRSQKLSDKHIIELSEISNKLELHYNKPMDIEWAVEDWNLFILQARPITTINNWEINNVVREKLIQRNFPPIAYTTWAYSEFHWIQIWPLHWIRDRETMITYKVPQVFLIQDQNAYYKTNLNDLIQEVNDELEGAVNAKNKNIFDIAQITPWNTYEDLNRLNEAHRVVYGLMIAGMDLAIELKELIDRKIKNPPMWFEWFIVSPWKKTAIQREQDELVSIVVNNEIENKTVIEKLALDYGYLHQDYFWEPRDCKNYLDLLKKWVFQESWMKEDFDLTIFDSYEQRLINLFKKFVYMYEEGRNAMVRVFWAMRLTCDKLWISHEKLLYMTESDIEELSLSKDERTILSDELFIKRKEAFALYFDNWEYKEYAGKEEVGFLIEKLWINHFRDKKVSALRELSGNVAYPGYVKGNARIVLTQEDAEMIEDGEILIAPMTEVGFLWWMRKCWAIVTDEWGLICHAAIVSREFGKPCVLSTWEATQAISTWDLIEVDANKWIVRILGKNWQK